MLSLDNFKLTASFCREEGYGGAAIYVKKEMTVRNRKKIDAVPIKEHFECASVECDLGSEQLIIIAIYRPPNGKINIFLK